MNKQGWEKAAAQLLVGKKIKSVSYLTKKELNDLGWDASALVIELQDGTCFYASRDDEGNGPGALFTTNNDLPIIPVIR